ncbi:hypothetical protein [Paraburkholderia sp.]|uniref:hypothetical protein n=1 Tax=Paraburkholderia sp. TaxID=1926495 RepID=UPI0039E287D4
MLPPRLNYADAPIQAVFMTGIFSLSVALFPLQTPGACHAYMYRFAWRARAYRLLNRS